jgi:DNA ligase 1
MPDLQDGESTFVQGSGSKPYEIKNVGGVYSCTCPAWRNQSVGIERRTCKHLRKLRGDAAEEARVGGALPQKPKPKSGDEGEAAAPPLLFAESWANDLDLTGWWMSEKLDGVRAFWDGKQFLSRLGNLYHAPEWFIDGLPPVPLDGELWLGRKQFQRTVSTVRRQDKSDHWKAITYVVFDAPALEEPFEKRMAFLRDQFERHNLPHARAHEHQQCTSLDHLRQELARLEALGAEGLMLRKPQSLYEVGRSSTLLKVKSFHDAEARVLEHLEGAGRHKGRLGALLVELADGTKFSVGTGFSDKERENPPAVGSLITFRYQELSEGGVPRFPSYVGVRAEAPRATKADAVENPQRIAPAKQAAASRRFEFVEGKSNKFWEVVVNANEMTTRWGRIGSTGQSKTKTFADEAAAARQAEKLIDEKTKEGYVEK